MILNLCQKRKQDVYVGREVDKTSDLRRKNFVIIFLDKYRSMSFPKTLLFCFTKRKWSEASPVDTDKETGFQIYDFC